MTPLHYACRSQCSIARSDVVRGSYDCTNINILKHATQAANMCATRPNHYPKTCVQMYVLSLNTEWFNASKPEHSCYNSTTKTRSVHKNSQLVINYKIYKSTKNMKWSTGQVREEPDRTVDVRENGLRGARGRPRPGYGQGVFHPFF